MSNPHCDPRSQNGVYIYNPAYLCQIHTDQLKKRHKNKLTSIQSIREPFEKVGKPRDHLDLSKDISVDIVTPLEQRKQLLLHFGRGDVVRVEAVCFGLGMDRLAFVHLTVTADGELGEDVFQGCDVGIVALGSLVGR